MSDSCDCLSDVVRNRISGGDGSFIMTIVADQSYTNARHTQELGNFHNNGDISGFSGLVIYTRLSGAEVRADRYLDGERVCCANLLKIQSMADFNGRIRELLKVFGVIRVNRTFSYLDTRCAYGCSPDDSCAHPEDNGYWDNDSTPIPLDSAGYCVADTTDLADPDGVFGPGASWGNDWLPDGYWDNNEPDPAPGGGGGSNVGAGGGNNNAYHLAVDGKNVTVNLESGLSSKDITTFKETFQKLSNLDIFKKIVANLDMTKVMITVLMPSNFGSKQSGKTAYRPKEEYIIHIQLNPQGEMFGYMEEFFHAEQYLFYSERWAGDIEFEAKAFFAEVFIKMGRDSLSKIFRDNLDYYKTILEYVKEPDEDKRCDALIAFQRLGYSNFQTKNDVKNLDEILKIYNKYFSFFS